MGTFTNDTGGFDSPPGGNPDFQQGSVINDSEVDGNFAQLADHLDTEFVDDTVIADGAIDGAKLTAGTVDGDRLIPGTVPAGSVVAGSIDNAELADGAVTDIKITGPIDGSKVGVGTLPVDRISGGSIPSPQTPVGAVTWYAGVNAPAEWEIANGQELDQVIYPALFSVIGTTYNTGGEAPGFFRVPDLRSRMVVGVGSQNNLADTDVEVGDVGEPNRNSPEHSHGLSGSIDAVAGHTHGPGSYQVTISGTTSTVSNGEFNTGFILAASGASKIVGNHGVVTNDFLPTGGGSGAAYSKSQHRHTFSDTSTATGVSSTDGAHTHTDTFSVDTAEPPYIVLTPLIYTGV